MLSVTEYMATRILQNSSFIQVIYSNLEVIEQNQYIFDTLWKTAILVDQKIGIMRKEYSL